MNEEELLRSYITKRYGGLRDDRSTYSYALEFLTTSDANLQAAQRRVVANLQLDKVRTMLANCVAATLELEHMTEKMIEPVIGEPTSFPTAASV